MTQWKLKSKRKSTGSLVNSHGKKEKNQRTRDYLPTHVGKIKKTKIQSKSLKIIAFSVNSVNVATKDGIKKTEIKRVIENKANLQFVRRNIITKGAIIETELGNAKVTSSPGQVGIVNAILIKSV